MTNFSKRDPDTLKELKLPERLAIGFSTTFLLLTTLLIAVYVSFGRQEEPQKNKSAYLEFIIAAVSASATAAGAAYALQSIRANTRQQEEIFHKNLELQEQNRRTDLTLQFINLWDEAHVAEARATVSAIFKDADKNKQDKYMIQQLIDSDPKSLQDVTLILNLLEKMAIARNKGLLDDEHLREFYFPIVNRCWDKLHFHVRHRRELVPSHKDLYLAIEKLHESWNSQDSYGDVKVHRLPIGQTFPSEYRGIPTV
jgi:hypothetical protein